MGYQAAEFFQSAMIFYVKVLWIERGNKKSVCNLPTDSVTPSLAREGRGWVIRQQSFFQSVMIVYVKVLWIERSNKKSVCNLPTDSVTPSLAREGRGWVYQGRIGFFQAGMGFPVAQCNNGSTDMVLLIKSRLIGIYASQLEHFKIYINMIRSIGVGFVGMLLMSHLAFGQSEVELINATINQNKLKGHLSFLASDALRGRNTGSEGLEAAAAYISAQFISHGVDTMAGMGDYLQWIPFQEVTPPDTATLMIGDRLLEFPNDFIILNGTAQHTTLGGKFMAFGQADDLVGKDVRFAMAVANAGNGATQDVGAWLTEAKEKRQRAIDAGAMGLVEIYQNPMVPWRFLKRLATQKQMSTQPQSDKRKEQFPHLWISATDSVAIDLLKSDKGIITLDMGGLTRVPLPSANVVGWVEGTDPDLKDEYIIYSAHYDHVGIGRADAVGDTIYNGARDNAVGATAVLALSEYIAAHPTKRSAIFVLFTAEEKGLLGSSWFVEHAPVDLERIKYCFNIDNGGYNDTSIVSVIGLTRTEAEASIQESCKAFGLTAIEDAAGEQGLFDRSDNVNFAKVGIPAPTFSLGFTAFDDEIFKYYHQPGDEVHTLDMDYIEKYVKAFILSSIKIGNADQAPFWNVGDKYYNAGKGLYEVKD